MGFCSIYCYSYTTASQSSALPQVYKKQGVGQLQTETEWADSVPLTFVTVLKDK